MGNVIIVSSLLINLIIDLSKKPDAMPAGCNFEKTLIDTMQSAFLFSSCTNAARYINAKTDSIKHVPR